MATSNKMKLSVLDQGKLVSSAILTIFLWLMLSESRTCPDHGHEPIVVLIKIGGSSVTHKGMKETVNDAILKWFATTLAIEIDSYFLNLPIVQDDSTCIRNRMHFVVVHGAGSFGHHTAKEFGLQGVTEPPPNEWHDSKNDDESRRFQMHGLSATRLSVQKLNRIVVSALFDQGINAVGISPCLAVPGIQAHGPSTPESKDALLSIVESALRAGLVPVLHGDACLYGSRQAGILSGDILMEILASAPWIHHAVFLTDVDGVFTRDPRLDPTALLLRNIPVWMNGSLATPRLFEAGASGHEHDVTGGLQVRVSMMIYVVLCMLYVHHTLHVFLTLVCEFSCFREN